MSRHLIALAAASALGFLILPFVGFALATPWTHLHTIAGDGAALRVSVVYTLAAMGLIVIGGTPPAYLMARRQFRGKLLCEALILLPLLTPPLAMGILLTLFYGPYGYAGGLARALGLELTNSRAAFILAQVYAAAPYFIIAARAAFEGIDPELERISLSLGKGRVATFCQITIPLAGLGLAAGLAIAWVRALGEFGIVLIVAYFPQGIPVKLWVNLQDIGLEAVYPLLWLFFLIALPLPLIFGMIVRRRPVELYTL